MKNSLILSTQTSMTQRVQQAIALLPMSALDLSSFVQEQLDENPFLMSSGPRESSYVPNSTADYIAKAVPEPKSVMDDLLQQLYIHTKSEGERRIGVWLLHNLDERGFFTMDFAEASQHLEASPYQIQKVLSFLHTFEPIGVGARSIAHCWRIQLEESGELTPNLSNFLGQVEQLSTQSLNQVARKMGLSLTVCQSMLEKLRRLSPYPFRDLIHDEDKQAVIPDIITSQNENGRWVPDLNADVLPQVLLNNVYLSEIRAQIRKAEDRVFINERVKHGRWLIQALQERAVHLLAVAECLLDFQQDYWTHGAPSLHPMTLKDIADRTGLHVSTISRLTTNKHIQTPQGVIPLKFFFSRSLTSLVSDSYESEGASNKTIQHRLRQFVQEEEHTTPYSDDRLVEMFQSQGVLVARRTINKYRQILNIPSSSERKRLYTLNPQSRF